MSSKDPRAHGPSTRTDARAFVSVCGRPVESKGILNSMICFFCRGHGDGFPIRTNEATEISWKRVGTPTLVPALRSGCDVEYSPSPPDDEAAAGDFEVGRLCALRRSLFVSSSFGTWRLSRFEHVLEDGQTASTYTYPDLVP